MEVPLIASQQKGGDRHTAVGCGYDTVYVVLLHMMMMVSVMSVIMMMMMTILLQLFLQCNACVTPLF